jgi:ligand-binding sensor domain-containing protein/two-component sensor histidine kinase
MYAQRPVVINLKEYISLPDIEFYDIAEDTNGIIWLAANKGLYKYDGKEFTKFENPTKKGRSVFNLTLDDQNRLWCVNIAAQLFYVKNDELITHANLGELVNFGLINIIIFEEAIYAFSLEKIIKIDMDSGAFEVIFESHDRIGNPLLHQNTLIFNAGANIYQIQNAIVSKTIQDSKIAIPTAYDTRNSLLMYDASENLYCFKYHEEEGDKLFVKHKNEEKFTQLRYPKSLQNKITIKFVEVKDQIWRCTDKGLYIFNMNNGNWDLLNIYNEAYFVTDVLVDSQENIWFTTLKNGILMMPNVALEKISLGEKARDISAIKKINEDEFLIGPNSGDVLKYNLQQKKYDVLDKTSKKRINFISDKLADDSFLLVDDQQSYAYKNGQLQLLKGTNFVGLKNVARYKDFLLSASYSSSKILAKKDNSYTVQSYIDNNRANIIYHDSIHNGIYVGAIDDFKWITTDGRKRKIRYNNKSIFITALAQTTDGAIWIGTSRHGVLKVDKDVIVKKVSVENGLLSNDINILKADGMHLWVSSDKGIQRYDTSNENIKSINALDGLESYTVAGLEIAENKIYFATNQNFYSFDKQRIFKSESKPRIYFKKVLSLNKEVPVKNKYQLPHAENKINFEFHSNGFKSSENIRYEYKIEKSTTEDWEMVNLGNNSIEFNSLSSGEYQFYVKAIDLKTGSISNILHAEISVNTPFWHEVWFIVLCIISIIGSTFLFTQNKARKKAKQQAIAYEKLTQEKLLIAANLESLRSQMNPHFIFNALTAIQDYIELNDKQMASEYLVKFAKLIRTYLEHSQQETVFLKDEVEALQIYLELEKERFEDNINIAFHVEETLLSQNYVLPSLFIQPYVENAIKHGLLHKKKDRQLRINFTEIDAHINIAIEDNGIGRKKAGTMKKTQSTHKSFANSANQMRLQLINQNTEEKIKVTIHDLEVAGKPAGTRVEISIPKKTNSFV